MEAAQIFTNSAEAILDLSLVPVDVDFAIFTPNDDSSVEEARNGLGMSASMRYNNGSYAFAASENSQYDDSLQRLDFLAGSSMFFIETNKNVAIRVLDDRCKCCKKVCSRELECPGCRNVRYCGMVCQIRDHFHRLQCPQLELERVYFESLERMFNLVHTEILTLKNFTVELLRHRCLQDAEGYHRTSHSVSRVTSPPLLQIPQLVQAAADFTMEDWEFETMD